jgi:hypothetical protein
MVNAYDSGSENSVLAYAAYVSFPITNYPHNYRSCWRALNVHGELLCLSGVQSYACGDYR